LVVGAPGVPDSVLRQLIGVVYLQPKRKFFFGLHQASFSAQGAIYDRFFGYITCGKPFFFLLCTN
jgi:hypothetical protein